MRTYMKLVLGIVCLSSQSCISFDEEIRFDKKGRGVATLSLDLRYLQLYANSPEVRSRVQHQVASLGAALQSFSGIKTPQAQYDSLNSTVEIKFAFQSLDALNMALTYLYEGEMATVFAYFKESGNGIIRTYPPNSRSLLTSRWAELVGQPLADTELSSLRFSHNFQFRHPISLVYAPVAARILEEEKTVTLDFPVQEMLDAENKEILILRN